MNRNIFLVLALVVMAAFAWYVRGTVLVPAQTAAGPELVSHRVDQYDEDCVTCHAKVADFHKENFETFSSDNCMNCHGGASGTPHPIDGTYAECLTCHEPIVATHDEMFPWENTSYEDCVSCHIPE